MSLHSITANNETYTINGTLDHSSYHIGDNNQYAYLADALLDGSLALEIEPPQWLVEMDNPYDVGQRMALAQESGEYALWDYAFYQGSYYCYFGVVPAIILFVPYKVLTGVSLVTPLAIEILGVLYIIALALLIYQISKLFHFQWRSELTVSLVFMLCCGASNVYYLGFASYFYSVPILSSMFFTALGLWCWLKAKDYLQQESMCAWRCFLFLGTLFMSLNFGCRPQFVLACVLAVPIFFDELFLSRRLFSSQSKIESLLVVLAVVIPVAPLMVYNYLRFGSVLDWGSSYNLTGFDMTDYQQSWRTSAWLTYSYLFQLPSFSSTFPFIDLSSVNLENGWAPNEPMFGGYIWLAPISFGLLLFPFVARDARRKKIVLLVIILMLCSVIVLAIDVRKAGITQRYFSDFGMYVYLAASLLIFQFIESCQAKREEKYNTHKSITSLDVSTPTRSSSYAALAEGDIRGMHMRGINIVANGVLLMLLAGSVIIGSLSFLSPERYYSISRLNPEFYSEAQQLLGE